jgi:hypothetical protein
VRGAEWAGVIEGNGKKKGLKIEEKEVNSIPAQHCRHFTRRQKYFLEEFMTQIYSKEEIKQAFLKLMEEDPEFDAEIKLIAAISKSPGFVEFITDPKFVEIITDPVFVEIITDPELVEIITNPGFVEIITDPEFLAKFNVK